IWIPSGNMGAHLFVNDMYLTSYVSTATFTPGWHYFAATYDGRYFKFYVDGELKSTDDADGNYPIQYDYTAPLVIGGEAGANSAESFWHFDGKVDEVKIWHCALSAEEITEEMGTNNFDEIDWYEITGNAPWAGRHGLSCTEFNDKIWLLGGLKDSIYNNEIWSSSDGSNWTFNGDAVWSKRGYHATTVFNDKLWIFGGNNPNSGPLNDVWSSSDGSNWTLVTPSAPWSTRVGTKSFVYDNKLWIVGGMHRDKTEFCDDVWSSVDGSNWTEVTSSAPWGGRGLHDSFVFNNKMWVMGGCVDGWQKYSKDVWSSSDGTNWTLATDNASCVERHYSSAAVFDGKMWICGSYHEGEQNDVWSSPDGANWTLITENAVWPDRCAQSVFTFNNALWVAGGEGHYNHQLNDVWSTKPFSPVIAGENSLAFDGVDDVVVISNEENFDFDTTDAFSLEAWVKTTSKNSGDQFVIAKQDLNSIVNGYYMILKDNDDDQLGFYLQNGGSTYIKVLGSTDVIDGEWHHVAAVYDGSGDASGISLYVDGKKESTTIVKNNLGSQGILNNVPLTIGTRTDNSHDVDFNGEIDEARVWNVALTESQVCANMSKHLAGNEPGLAGYWRFDEGSGQTAYDSSSNGNNGRLGSTENVDDQDPVWTPTKWPHGNCAPCELIAYYPFNGNANDESGNGHDGTVNGATLTTDRFGNPNSAYSFDGQNDYIRAADFDFSRTNISVIVWLQCDSNTVGRENIIGKGNNESNIELLMKREPDGKYDAEWTIGGKFYDLSGPVNDSIGLIEPSFDSFDMLVLTYNGQEISFYMNGVLITNRLASGEIIDNSLPLTIGTGYDISKGPIKGVLDDICIYNCALSASKVAELYNDKQNCLIAYYPFNGNANDESGNGHTGTVNGATLTTDMEGNPNSAYSFDGQNDYIIVPNADELNVTGSLTITAWVNSRDISRGGQDIISKTQGGCYSLTLNEGSLGTPEGRFSFLLDVNGPYQSVSSNIKTKDYHWYFVAGVYDGTTAKIYVNGILENEIPLEGPIDVNTYPLTIGNECGQLSEPFDGKIDEVKIWNCALSAEEIAKEAEKYKTYDPVVDITTEDTSVTYDVTEFAVEGSNNINVVGGMTVSNPATQATAVFDAAS
ncbi:MAG: hypothetical protein DRI32_06545, partial [Chloroflexi bacterium]